MRFKLTFLAGFALLTAFLIFAQIEAQNPALAQFGGAPNDASNPILRLPAPPQAGAIAIVPTPKPAPPIPITKPTAKLTPTPVPTLKLRFTGQNPIRVGLSTRGGPLQIYVPGGATLFDLNQPKQVLSLPKGARFEVKFGAVQPAKPFRGPLSIATSGAFIPHWQRIYLAVNGEPARVTSNGENPRYGRPYRGDLEVFSQKLGEPNHRKGPLSLVNIVPLEAYLRGVVPWEMSPDAPFESLKAQAICARTKALDFLRSKRFAAGDFQICDYDACQGYPGTENEKPATTQAVEATKGLAIYHRNRPIDAVYSTNSGGITANARDVWPQGAPIPYLQSVADFPAASPGQKLWQSGMNEAKWAQFCAENLDSFAKPDGVSPSKYEARKYRWSQFVSVENATKAFAIEGFGAVTNLEVGARAASGRIKTLKISGFPISAAPIPTAMPNEPVAPPKTLLLQGDGKIRAMFSKRLGSTTALPSSLFTIAPSIDPSGKLLGWNLSGAGWGHGVGMCQRGAQNHAKQGWDARKILNFYYRGVEIR